MKYQLEYIHTEKDFEDVFEIEQKYLEPNTIADTQTVIEWERRNPDIHILARDNEKDKIVGEITLLPLYEEQFNRFMINELEDTELNKDTLLEYKPDIECFLLLSVIAIDREYRKEREILSLLLRGMYEKIKSLLNKNIRFLNMCAEGQTEEGQKFIDGFLNLKHKYTTKDGYKLYSFDNKEDFNDWLIKFPKYIVGGTNEFKI